jgi:membrane fusion protein, copper/silver efflux system
MRRLPDRPSPLMRLATGTGTRLAIAIVILAVITGLAACARGSENATATLYQCPMHPTYISDHPGDCPICGMRLVRVDKAAITSAPTPSATPGVAASRAATIYPCPMHPEIRDTKPGECPKCGMDLVPVKGASQGAAGHDAATVDIGAEGARVAGVRTAVATSGQITMTIRAVGSVAPDEARIREVTTKVPGFVEKLYVNTVGQLVRAGEPLFELYSPELLASQEEYLRAKQAAATFERSSLPEVQRGGQDLARAARQRLELFDVPAEFLERLDRTGQAERRVVFRAPFSGFVTVKNVLEGQRIEPGMNLLTVTDLSHIWVVAQVYEAEAAAAQTGRPATVTLPYDPAVKLTGRVTFVYPTLDPESRTLKVRLEFANPRLALKPNMFVNVELASTEARGVVVPDSAIVDTGARQVVFVEIEPGTFAPRNVQVAARSDGKAVVQSGLGAGERVAIAANFLLDSESRLRSALGAAK